MSPRRLRTRPLLRSSVATAEAVRWGLLPRGRSRGNGSLVYLEVIVAIAIACFLAAAIWAAPPRSSLHLSVDKDKLGCNYAPTTTTSSSSSSPSISIQYDSKRRVGRVELGEEGTNPSRASYSSPPLISDVNRRLRGGEISSTEKEMPSLARVITNTDLNFIFVGGKGGVGKTTISSSLAIQRAQMCAELGKGDVLLISTDPAHSLSDAFKINFTGDPTKVPGVKGLWVMEIDPSKMVEKEMGSWQDLVSKAGMDEFMGEFNKLQSWLTSLPGIDEATALASALERIRSKEFGTIIFDTAPTGHTIKLLKLPEVLQVGIDKLAKMSSKVMGYINTFKNLFAPKPAGAGDGQPNVQELLANKLKDYQKSIQILSNMLRDQNRTNFVIVCIAEYLSVMESQRLVHDLELHGIANTHIVVNQLVRGAPTGPDIKEIAGAIAPLDEDVRLRLAKCVRLMTAREKIQTKYLSTLRTAEDLKNVSIVPMPLMPTEVTGVDKLKPFSQLLLEGYDEADLGFGCGLEEGEEAGELFPAVEETFQT